MKSIFLYVIASTALTAQTTTIGPHRLGETFQEWLTTSRIDLTGICEKAAAANSGRKHQPDIQSTNTCNKLTAIGNTGKGFFDMHLLEEPVDVAALRKTIHDMTTAKTDDDRMNAINNSKTHNSSFLEQLQWSFVDGKVAEANFSSIGQTAFEEQAKLLTEAYGPPNATKIVPYQNAFGAHWDCSQAFWQVPDGARIIAVESIVNIHGMRREVNVTFISAEEASRLSKPTSPPNPYKQ